MLRLFLVLMFVLVFSITMIPYSYANHDDTILLHVQNNTGWDREIFHDYDLFIVTDKFGEFVLPYKFESDDYVPVLSDVKIRNVVMHNNLNELPLSIVIEFENITNFINLDIFMPIFNYSTVVIYDYVFIDGEQTNYNVHPFDTHTKYAIIIEDASTMEFFSGILDYESKSYNEIENMIYDYIFPPLKQTQNGVEPQNILCKENMELILHPNGSPACVKPESIPKLIQRGWKN